MFASPAASWLSNSPNVVIDWADVLASASADTNINIDSFLDWVRTSPERAHIHVVLPPARRYQSGTRFQRTLQSLGCTVTRKTLAYS